MNTLISVKPSRINNVMTARKDTYLQLRVRDDIKADLQILAELRGLTMSGFIHSMIVRAIREEKELYPDSFKQTSIKHGGTIRVKTEAEIRGKKNKAG